MAFDWPKLYALAKKTLIWGVLFFILFILRDLFGFVLLTFILAFITYRISEFAVELLPVTRRVIICVIYVVLICVIGGMGYVVVPRVFEETRQFAKDLPELETKLGDLVTDLKTRYPELAPIIVSYGDRDRIREEIALGTDRVAEHIPLFVKTVLHVLSMMILSIFFSFLIVMDLARLRREVKRFRDTKLHDFYQETAMPVVRFGQVVGRAFEAQTLIALANTFLTVLGMVILGIPRTALLGVIVFFCSFIPVLGVFISSIPIILVAFNSGGIWLAGCAVAVIILVHLLEAYVLNPRIYAYHMGMNPVVTLIVLFLGHHLFGVYGMLLAVPVAYYFLTHVAGLRPRLAKTGAAGSAGAAGLAGSAASSTETPPPDTPFPQTPPPQSSPKSPPSAPSS